MATATAATTPASASSDGGRNSKLETVLKIGTLVDMDWKMGVGIVSSSCQRLDEPFVKLVLKVQDSSQVVSAHSFELSLDEFKSFAESFRNIARAI
mmetsp:Transcript_33124/g.83249  ORF Transcript_33124/g.83249 Transcript_33124/m.83249 type:complete len:96 (-) Transcript_33124:47-334(-)|eukprot:CAMPEP_0177654300 /NCGR_PEP_ID=MMETSP0447-20121125/14249_1 /TAXON_ID=0 /ORGANISM="Stygamoeba regulata, Strain BSH-02190019" /LENGTH=95 /DNA_ID=CAMNT_0019157921 /DNA_START=44 /DNA_END=331 /DNA_ORIENTATION=+